MNVIDHLKGPVTFQFYLDGFLYFKTQLGLVFPVELASVPRGARYHEIEDARVFVIQIRQAIMYAKRTLLLFDNAEVAKKPFNQIDGY